MKTRRHHNNKGLRQIKNGGTYRSLKRIARKLGLSHALNNRCLPQRLRVGFLIPGAASGVSPGSTRPYFPKTQTAPTSSSSNQTEKANGFQA